MASPTILRIPRSDRKEHLLLHVASNGSKPLDLKLIGTEQQHLYHANIKDSEVDSLQASNSSGDLGSWRAILGYVLLHQRPPDQELPQALRDVECVAAIKDARLTVTIRRNVSGITQRLGSVRLDEDDEREEVSAFGWVDTVVATADQLRAELVEAQARLREQKDAVAELNLQLDELVQAKKSHEQDMLGKFAALLNAKKLKIRDQQRLLNAAHIDTTAVDEPNSARGARGPRVGASRAGKRKTADVGHAEGRDEAAGNGEDDEMQDAEPLAREETSSSGEEQTETEDEAEHDAGGGETAVRSSNGKDEARSDYELPPKRVLPFGRSGAASEPSVQPHDDEETDDEL